MLETISNLEISLKQVENILVNLQKKNYELSVEKILLIEVYQSDKNFRFLL